ncbi:MAG: carbohydrate ABC transporter permease [Streptosporangiales bacterium]
MLDERTRAPAARSQRARRSHRWTRRDRVVIALMVAVPTVIFLGLVWAPALISVGLSFTRWDGIGLDAIQWVGWDNYRQIFTIYPPFKPALLHNLIWLLFFMVLATPLGLFLAVLLDKDIRGTRIYQSAIFLPVVLSLAIVGFIWQLIYSPDQGLINQLFGTKVDWFGNAKINLWAVLVAASWRHVGYMMILYLAGLKGVDPSLRESAALDGASEWQAFRYVVFPALRPVNIIVLVITVIESLRAFDIVYIINGGRNGLELLSALVTQNIIGEASRIGYGSAIAAIMLLISTVFIIVYTVQVFREER